MVFNREITSGPATPPTLHLPKGKAHRIGSVLVPQAGLFMKEQREAIALNDLNRRGSSTNGVECVLHEIVGEVTTSGKWTWHSGFLSLPGFFWGLISLYQKSRLSTTLFVKRTTKRQAERHATQPSCTGSGSSITISVDE